MDKKCSKVGGSGISAALWPKVASRARPAQQLPSAMSKLTELPNSKLKWFEVCVQFYLHLKQIPGRPADPLIPLQRLGHTKE